MKQVNASISVFLALTISLVLAFCMALVESARENAMLLKADLIFQIGVQSVMAEYHHELWEKYELFYLDCSYGTETPNYENIGHRLQKYIDENLRYDGRGWLSLQYEDGQISEVRLASDYIGEDLYTKAVESVKESMGLSFAEQALKWLEQVEATSYIEEYLEHENQETYQVIGEVNGSSIEVKEEVWGFDKKGQPILLEEAEYETVDIHNPLDRILSGNILLKKVTDSSQKISLNKINIKSLPSKRALAAGSAPKRETETNLLDKALFCNYVLEHLSSFSDYKNETKEGLQYSLEYLIGGKESDNLNMEIVIGKLMVIREIDNYLKILQDEIRLAEAEAIGAAAATLVPWVAPIVTQATLIYWAYEESINDVQRLLEGESVSLVKAIGLNDVGLAELNYEQYLYILLLMQSKDTLILRTMDMIEMDIGREQYGFRIDACVSFCEIQGVFMDIYNKKYYVTQKVQY